MKAIVYTSNTGFTAQYARILSEKTGLPAMTLEDARNNLPKGTPIVYMGWLFVGSVKDYRRAAKHFTVKAVCGVGLCDTGSLLPELRKSMKLPDAVPVFTFQGGMDHDKLTGIYQHMIQVLVKVLSQKKRTEDEDKMLALIKAGGSHVSESYTEYFMNWYKNENTTV